MDSKFCVVCNIEKITQNFYNKDREFKRCNIKTNSKRHNDNKDKLSIYEKKKS